MGSLQYQVTPHSRDRAPVHRVHAIRRLSDDSYVLRFDRHGLVFEPGQYVSVGAGGDVDMREYSVYSGVEQDFLEILVRKVASGYVSRRLARLAPGDEVSVDGPFGYFTIEPEFRGAKHVFIATGTGISPFHNFALSYPRLDYRVLHGIRTLEDRYEHALFGRRYLSCVSRGAGGDYTGRVTAYLRDGAIDPDTRYYLCGNCDMIYECFDILQTAGVPHHNLFAEVYF